MFKIKRLGQKFFWHGYWWAARVTYVATFVLEVSDWLLIFTGFFLVWYDFLYDFRCLFKLFSRPLHCYMLLDLSWLKNAYNVIKFNCYEKIFLAMPATATKLEQQYKAANSSYDFSHRTKLQFSRHSTCSSSLCEINLLFFSLAHSCFFDFVSNITARWESCVENSFAYWNWGATVWKYCYARTQPQNN